MQLVAIEAVVGAEVTDLLLDAPLLSLESCELVFALGERAQILGYECAHGSAAFGRTNSCCSVDVLRNGYGDVSHCASQYHRNT